MLLLLLMRREGSHIDEESLQVRLGRGGEFRQLGLDGVGVDSLALLVRLEEIQLLAETQDLEAIDNLDQLLPDENVAS